MTPFFYGMVLAVVTAGSLVGCALQQSYDPALPAARMMWDNSPLIPVVPPEGLEATDRPAGAALPAPDEWNSLTPHAPDKRRGKKRQTAMAANGRHGEGIVIRGPQTAQILFPYVQDAIYEIPTAIHSATHLILPEGERLASQLTANPEAWAIGYVKQGEEPRRREIIVARPIQEGRALTTGIFLESGATIFCRFLVRSQAAVSVRWQMPKPESTTRPMPVNERPPKLDVTRIHAGYRVELLGNVRPPWWPNSIFDDGTKTVIKFTEALTFTRAPAVTGLTQQGTAALVQSHMYVTPGQPEKGAWLLVQGLWPALELQDSTGIKVRIVRSIPAKGHAQEVKYVP